MSDIDKYVEKLDWRIRSNSNTSFSVSDMEAKISEKESAKWWLSQYRPEIAEAHRTGALYLHNLGRVTTYCMGWDLRALLQYGFRGNPAFLTSAPPHHLRVAFLQMANFLYTMQGEAAGAQAFSNVDTLLAPFIRYENLSDKELEQAIQELVYNLNVPTRASGQPPFLNFQLDIVPPKSLASQVAMIGDKPIFDGSFTYGDFQPEMNRFNKAFAKVMMQGDGEGKPLSFPIPTYSLPNLKLVDIPEIWEMTAKYGLPYFMMDVTNEEVYSMCKPATYEVLVTNSKGIQKMTIADAYDAFKAGTEMSVLTEKGTFASISDMIAIPFNENMVEIQLNNGVVDKMTPDHPSMIIKEDGSLIQVPSSELKIGDYIPVIKNGYQGDLGDFDLGRFVGLAAGDGWISGANEQQMFFDFAKAETHLISFVTGFANDRLASSVTVEEYDSHNRICVHGTIAAAVIRTFITDGGALGKRLKSACFGTSFEFRKGFVRGVIDSDGYEKNGRTEVHLGNKGLVEDVFQIALSVGVRGTIHSRQNATGDKKKTSYVWRMTTANIVYKDFSPEYSAVKIVSITPTHYKGTVYDFVVDSPEHLFVGANGIITHNCCHLQLDRKALMFRNGGIFAKFPLTGSVGVVTISLPAMSAMKTHGKNFFDTLKDYMDMAKDSLLVKGELLEKLMDGGLYPYSKYWLTDIKQNTGSYFGNHFRTIGIVGMNEACIMETGSGINTERGREWAKSVLEYMAKVTGDYTDETGFLFNLEATPAETATYYCARGNLKAGLKVEFSGTKETPYYTASSLLPSSFDGGLWAALDNQSVLQPLYTGGTVFHIYSEHQFSPKQTEQLIFAIKNKYTLPYLTFTPNIRICPEHGWIPDDVNGKCPICGKEVTVYSRPVGYLRPVSGFSDAKQEEFKARQFFDDGL